MSKPPTPFDPLKCQTHIREGSFMTLGPRGWIQCGKPPIVIVTEKAAGSDGYIGSMSMCEPCFEVFQGEYPSYEDSYELKFLQAKKNDHA